MFAEVTQIRHRVRMRRRLQAVLQGLVAILKWAGLLYAIPGMVVLVLLVAGAALPAIVILAALILVQLPLYWMWRALVVSDERWEEKRVS